MKKPFFYLTLLLTCLSALEIHAQKKTEDITHFLRVESPIPNKDDALIDGFTITDKVTIVVKFSREVKVSTVIVGKTLLLAFPKDGNAKADLIWTDNNKTLTITTTKPFADLRGPTTDQNFKLTLKGTRRDLSTVGQMKIIPGGVQATNGQYLDGNGDLKEGGDYVVWFRQIG